MTNTSNNVNYFSCAENDYQFFRLDVENGRVANYLAAMAQNIVERYLKHVIDQEYHPTSGAEEYDKAQNLRAHNLNKLVRCVNDHTRMSERKIFRNVRKLWKLAEMQLWIISICRHKNREDNSNERGHLNMLR